MKISFSALFPIVLALCVATGCGQKKDQRLSVLKVRSFIIDKGNASLPAPVQFIESASGLRAMVFLLSQNKLSFYNLDQTDTVRSGASINLGGLLQNRESLMDAYYHNADSIFVQTRQNRILMVNEHGELKHTWQVSRMLPDGNTGGLVMYPWTRLRYRNGALYSAYSPDNIPPGNTEKSFSRNFLAVIPLSPADTLVISETKVPFPDHYRKNFYYTFDPVYTFGHNGSVVSSFHADDALYLTHGATTTHIPQQARLAGLEPFPADSLINYRFIGRYGTEQPSYTGLTYDAHRKHYSRVLKKGCEHLLKDGTIGSRLYCPWQLIVLDENLQELGALEMPANQYLFDIIAPVKEGLLVGYYNSDEELRNNQFLRLQLLTIKTNEAN